MEKNIDADKTAALRALKNGPPALTRVEDYLAAPQANAANEINLLAEIDSADIFKLTTIQDGAEATKYIVPLYAATKALPETATAATVAETQKNANVNTRYNANILARKMLIGAIVSDDPNIMEKTVALSSGRGTIGPIVKVDGQTTTIGAQYEKQAEAALMRLGIIYGGYHMQPVYLKAFFGNRDAILQNQINQDSQGNPIYPVAYAFLLIAYFRCLWSIISTVSGTSDPSFINAVIRRFSKKPRSAEVLFRSASIKRKPPPLFKQGLKPPINTATAQTESLIQKHPNETRRKQNLFGHLKQAPGQTRKSSIETADSRPNQVLVRPFSQT
ncbi:MAG: hypothetical protein QM492_01875 [Rhodobacterales bacterium]